MSELFKYDIVSLIEFVESKHCLWDKTTDVFKDRFEKTASILPVYVKTPLIIKIKKLKTVEIVQNVLYCAYV